MKKEKANRISESLFIITQELEKLRSLAEEEDIINELSENTGLFLLFSDIDMLYYKIRKQSSRFFEKYINIVEKAKAKAK